MNKKFQMIDSKMSKNDHVVVIFEQKVTSDIVFYIDHKNDQIDQKWTSKYFSRLITKCAKLLTIWSFLGFFLKCTVWPFYGQHFFLGVVTFRIFKKYNWFLWDSFAFYRVKRVYIYDFFFNFLYISWKQIERDRSCP